MVGKYVYGSVDIYDMRFDLGLGANMGQRSEKHAETMNDSLGDEDDV